MSWYRIKSYSNVNHIDLSSKTQISSGITLIFAHDNPFCISVADREFRLLKNDFCIFFLGTHYRIYTDKNTAARIIYLELAPDREYSGYQSIKRLAESESNLEKMLFCKRDKNNLICRRATTVRPTTLSTSRYLQRHR